MYTYEATFILQPGVSNFENGKTELKKEFEHAEIKILKEEDKGEQSLSYPIKKNLRGHYMFFQIEAPAQSLVSLNRVLKIRPEILKYLFIRT